MLKREARKVGYLKRRLLEDLRLGEKILVRKAGPQEGPAEAAALLRALRRHGPAELLIVRAAEGPASVRRHEGGWLEGTVARFAPYDLAAAVHLPPWLDLCRRTGTSSKADPIRSRRRRATCCRPVCGSRAAGRAGTGPRPARTRRCSAR